MGAVEDAWVVLNAVNDGDVTVADIRERSPCLYDFILSNGWVVTAFDDCGDWDYIESVACGDSVLSGDWFFSFNADYSRWRWHERPNVF